MNILFVGNSFTGRNDLPGLLERLAASAAPPRPVHTRSLLGGGMSLQHHLTRGEIMSALQEQSWDYVVLQEQSTKPLKSPAKMHEAIRRLDGAIRAAGAQTALYETWARKHEPDRQGAITEAYASIARELNALLIPVGSAWRRSLTEYPDIALHDPDNSHPSLAGSYLAACVFYRVLFHDSPAGLWRPAGLSEEQAAVLQDAASHP